MYIPWSAIFLAGLLALIVLNFAYGANPWSANTAAWVQAVGSVGAILVAAVIAHRDSRVRAEQELKVSEADKNDRYIRYKVGIDLARELRDVASYVRKSALNGRLGDTRYHGIVERCEVARDALLQITFQPLPSPETAKEIHKLRSIAAVMVALTRECRDTPISTWHNAQDKFGRSFAALEKALDKHVVKANQGNAAF